MNFLLDIIIIIILGLSIFLAAKDGFFKALLSGTAFLLALIITIIFASPLRDALVDTDMYRGMKNGIKDTVTTLILGEEKEEEETEKKPLDGIFKDEKVLLILDAAGLDAEELQKEIDISKDVEKFVGDLIETVSEKIAMLALGVISAVLLFLCAFATLKILAVVLTAVCKIPVLKQANTFMGALLGAVLGLIRVLAFVAVIDLLLPIMQSSSTEFFAAVDPASTYLFKFFSSVNLLSFLG